jgi:hypothetical protein
MLSVRVPIGVIVLRLGKMEPRCSVHFVAIWSNCNPLDPATASVVFSRAGAQPEAPLKIAGDRVYVGVVRLAVDRVHNIGSTQRLPRDVRKRAPVL